MANIDIGVAYLPGLNGRQDMVDRIKEFGMNPNELYFHINHKDLEKNSEALADMDGLVLPGGFPYEDRLGFGRVASLIPQYVKAIKDFVNSGKPVLAVCAGNQGLHELGVLFPEDSGYKASLSTNICSDEYGEIDHNGFYNKKINTVLNIDPRRNAFTRSFEDREILEAIISHGGGRFTANKGTMQFILENGLIVAKYCDREGNVIDNFPINPNGSYMNIEALSNVKGNVLTGMVHHERKLNALYTSRSNLVFESMREYIEDGCPDLSQYAVPQDLDDSKDFSYLVNEFDPSKTVEVSVEMLTDDNELNTARLIVGDEIDFTRRRLIKIETAAPDVDPKVLLQKISEVDVLAGVMLKKDLPTIKTPRGHMFEYSVTGVEGNKEIREMRKVESQAKGHDVVHQVIPDENIQGRLLRSQLSRDPSLEKVISKISVGESWHFESEEDKKKIVEKLKL